MRKLMVWLAAAGVGLTAVTGPADAAPAEGSASDTVARRQISLVPLDDRPFTSVGPLQVATIGGFDAVAPDRADLGNFLDHGDPDAVGQWWSGSVETSDASVVAVPMLAYGGLVASRTCATDLDTALDRLDSLADVKAAHPEHEIYAFDVIQRLTIEPTSGYPGMYSGDLRRWAELYDKVENLGMEELRADYEALTAAIPEEILDDYLCARQRNHEVNKAMIRAADAGTIDFLVLGQDDASEFGPHRAEKLELQQLVADLDAADVVKIYPGADILGAMLVAKYAVKELRVSPTVQVQWSRANGDDWVAPYPDIPYGRLVDEYIATLGAQRLDDADADILLAANTAGAGSLAPFVADIERAVAAGRTVAIGDDAVAGVMDRELVNLVEPTLDHAELGGWSGWNVGLSLTQAVVRTAFLEASRTGGLEAVAVEPLNPPKQRTLLEDSAHAHLTLLAQEAIHTDLYRNDVRDTIRRFAVDAGDDPQHMTQVLDEARQLAIDLTAPLAEAFFAREFEGVTIPLGSDGAAERVATISPLHDLALGLAWPRYQELHVDPTFTLETEASLKDVVLTATPSTLAALPDRAGEQTVELVVRNRGHATTLVKLGAQLPEGWAADVPASVTLAPGASRTVPVVLSWAPVAADSSATATFTAQAPGSAPVETTVTVAAEWHNFALAANGATATASSEWRQYTVDRVIDGNVSSVASRWISEQEAEPWLTVDFGRSAVVDRVTAYHYGGYVVTDFVVEARVGGEWRPVATVAGNSATVTETVFAPVEADAIRLSSMRTRDQTVRLYEVEVTCEADACS